MAKKNPFDRKKIRDEISRIIKEVNEAPIPPEIIKEKSHNAMVKLLSLNSKTIVNMGKLVNAISDTTYSNKKATRRIIDGIKNTGKYIIFSVIASAASLLLAISTIIYLLFMN